MASVPRRSDRRNEFIQHPSVKALLAADPSTGCPRQAIRNRVSDVVAKEIKSGWIGPPYKVGELASRRGMRVQRARLEDDQDGCFIPGPVPTICVNRKKPKVRARYTVAHEIVHSLVPDVKDTKGPRYWSYRIEEQSPVEQLCQVGASEILMPTHSLQDVIGDRPESIGLAHDVARTFWVSFEAAVRNLVDLSAHECAMVILRFTNKPSEERQQVEPALPGFEAPPPPKRLRVQYAWTSRAWDHLFVPQFKSVPDDSIAYVALEPNAPNNRRPFVSTEDWSDVGGLGLCHVEAVKMRSQGPHQAVLCLLTSPQ